MLAFYICHVSKWWYSIKLSCGYTRCHLSLYLTPVAPGPCLTECRRWMVSRGHGVSQWTPACGCCVAPCFYISVRHVNTLFSFTSMSSCLHQVVKAACAVVTRGLCCRWDQALEGRRRSRCHVTVALWFCSVNKLRLEGKVGSERPRRRREAGISNSFRACDGKSTDGASGVS